MVFLTETKKKTKPSGRKKSTTFSSTDNSFGFTMGLGLSFGIIVVPFETTASFKFTTEISQKIFALLSPSYSILAPKLTKKIP